MPTYLYWGDDTFRLSEAVKTLQAKVLDPVWSDFNFDKIDAQQVNNAIPELIQGLNQIMTPPLGNQGRLVWIANAPLTSQASDFLSELERTLPDLPEHAHLLFTFEQKPDARSKAYKFMEKYAQVQEFQAKPTWKTQDLIKDIQHSAQGFNLKLTPDIIDYLVEALGNRSLDLHQALTKLDLFQQSNKRLALEDVQALIPNLARNSLQLSNCLCQGQTSKALLILQGLRHQNEPALKIVATLSRQFRTWTWIKIMHDAGEQNEQAIAKAADIRNPKRLYFLRKDIQHLKASQLKKCLQILRTLELELKTGGETASCLQTRLIELAIACRPRD